VNKYYPPDWDPSKGSLNRMLNQHPLRSQGNTYAKVAAGLMTIRFEVPWDFWCEKCQNHVAKGVRFNAEKKCIGNYFTTKIWQFSMTCHRCSNPLEFITDPKGCDYVLQKGGRRKEESYSAESAETIEFQDKEEREKIAADPFQLLEHLVDDKNKAAKEHDRLEALQTMNQSKRDDYELSKLARRQFRTEKKTIVANDIEATRADLRFKLLPASDTDALSSNQQVFINPLRSAAQTVRADRVRIATRPLFGDAPSAKRARTQELLLQKVHANIKSSVLGSANHGLPLNGKPVQKPSNQIVPNLVIKRKEVAALPALVHQPAIQSTGLSMLGDYDEDE
jgi:coiled-coil domain-containing protein 130